jgi:CheY-like chemotaxis protein
LEMVEVALVEDELGGIYLQTLIDEVIHGMDPFIGDRPVAVIAAFPAHFPQIAGERTVLQRVLSSLLVHIVFGTSGEEVRVRAQLMPANLIRIPVEMLGDESSERASPLALISISEQEKAGEAAGVDQVQSDTPRDSQTYLTYEQCQEAVLQAGGYLWREQISPETQTIWIALPLKTVTHAGTDVSQLKKAVATHLPQRGDTDQLILMYLVEESLRRQLTGELVEVGYRVDECLDATELLAQAKGVQPDLIILDLQARDPGAFDLARIIKQDTTMGRIPILFLTTFPDAEGELRIDTASFLIQSQGTGAMLATVQAALSSGIMPASRVLVAEPNDALREQMILRIQAQGHPVVEASSAEEALALAERTRFGLVLANATLAQGRDYWLIRQLKSISPDLKILVVAERLSEKDGRAALLRGASGFGDTGRLSDLLKKLGDN